MPAAIPAAERGRAASAPPESSSDGSAIAGALQHAVEQLFLLHSITAMTTGIAAGAALRSAVRRPVNARGRVASHAESVGAPATRAEAPVESAYPTKRMPVP